MESNVEEIYTMTKLIKLTTKYNDIEDRIEIIGETSQNDYVTFSLTQRLLLRLLPSLFTWLETHNSLCKGNFTNQNLKLDECIESEVKPASITNTQNWLVEEVDITANVSYLSLRFRKSHTEQTLLNLTAPELVQWLLILRSLWKISEWHSTVWQQYPVDSDFNKPPPESEYRYH